MVDYQAIKNHFDKTSLAYFTFYPKSLKPIKAVIRHLPTNTPAQDISDGLVDLGFDVVSVKQMTSARRPPDGSNPIPLPLFLVTLPRTTKSPEIFKLSSLCHICIKVEAYKSQSSLTQCFNCQQFGHVWANCKQPPRCMWGGDGHLHKDCPEKGERVFDSGVLQLPAGRGREATSCKLPRLQAREGRDAEEETAGDTQTNAW
jgi:hypothetical protein